VYLEVVEIISIGTDNFNENEKTEKESKNLKAH
jgi:hypothetical protein